jgi:phage/conjugal plasmid C-4 type zinc finger TraR family protein
MDNVDRAQMREEEMRARALDKIAQHAPMRQDGADCLACGEEIDARRRAAVPGVCLCIQCQEQAERLRR